MTAALVVLSSALAIAMVVGYLMVRSLRRVRKELTGMASQLEEIRKGLLRVAAKPIEVGPEKPVTAGDHSGPTAYLVTRTPVIKVRALGAGTRHALARHALERQVKMFARLRWLIVGAVVGLGGRAWARRVARRALRRSPPVRAVAGIAKVSSEVKAAVREGRGAMTAREAELVAQRQDRARSG